MGCESDTLRRFHRVDLLSILCFIIFKIDQELKVQALTFTPKISATGEKQEMLICSLEVPRSKLSRLNLQSSPSIEWNVEPLTVENRNKYVNAFRTVNTTNGNIRNTQSGEVVRYSHTIEIVDAPLLSNVQLGCSVLVSMGAEDYKSNFLSLILKPKISVSGSHNQVLNCTVVVPPGISVTHDPVLEWEVGGVTANTTYPKAKDAFTTISKDQDGLLTDRRRVTYHHAIEIHDRTTMSGAEFRCATYVNNVRKAFRKYDPSLA